MYVTTNKVSCNKVRAVNIDWARPQAGLTWLFEAFVMDLMKEIPVAAVARQVNELDTRSQSSESPLTKPPAVVDISI